MLQGSHYISGVGTGVVTAADLLAKAKCSILFQDLDLGSLIGDGSFGSVTKGTHKGAPVAIKQLTVGNDYDPASFAGEADLMARLESDHVVPFHGLCLADVSKIETVRAASRPMSP